MTHQMNNAATHFIKAIKMLNTQWVKENPDENATLLISFTL